MRLEQSGRWVYVLDPEEIPMTFQVGMVGSDGIILASDTLCTTGPGYPGAIRSTYNSSKIETLEDKNLAFCWAGDQLGRTAAEIISSNIDNVKAHPNVKYFLMECAQQSLIRALAETGVEDIGNFRTCMALVVMRQPQRHPIGLWRLEILNHVTPRLRAIYVEPVTTKNYAGDVSNPAVYFAERYFYQYRKMPIQELSLLAAHTVLMAGKLSSGVGGLQIALCRDSGFTILSDEEIADLRERSEKLDADLAVSLGVSSV